MKLSGTVLTLCFLACYVHGAQYSLPLYYNPLGRVYHPVQLGLIPYRRQCTGILGCLGQAIDATNQGIVTGAQGIIQGGVAAGSGIASGVGAAVGGVASGIGTGVGGIASGTGQAVGGVASGTGQAVGGVASGTGGAIGGAASGTGQAIGGQNTRRQLCYSAVGNYYFYCN